MSCLLALELNDADADVGSCDARENWVDCVPCEVISDVAKSERQLAARVRKVRNFSASPSYSVDPQSSFSAGKWSSVVLRHSRISYPSSADSTRMVAVLAVPAGPVKTRMRYLVFAKRT